MNLSAKSCLAKRSQNREGETAAVLHITSSAFPATVVCRFFMSLSSEALTQPVQHPSLPLEALNAPDWPAAQQGMA